MRCTFNTIFAQAAQEARAVFQFPLLNGAIGDIRYALRGMRRDRAFTIVAILSLALGIAANVAVFGLMDAILWRELPVHDPESLVSFDNAAGSYFAYSEFAKHSSSALQDVLAQSSVTDTTVDFGSGPAHTQVEFVSGNYFRALGVIPAYGRLLLGSDDDPQSPARAVILSYNYWRKVSNGDPSDVGRTLRLGKGQFTIIGVAPEDFFGLTVGEAPDIWLPVTAYPVVFSGTNWLSSPNMNWLSLFGRLRNGVSRSRAEAMLAPVSVQIDIERNGHAATEAERKEMMKYPIRLEPAASGISELRDRFSKPLHAVFGMLGIGLFLACINVVSLQIARSHKRQREFAVRLAIGASRFRVMRQCFLEALMLAAAGGVAGCLLFRPLTGAVTSVMTTWSGDPARLSLSVHSSLVAFVALVCLMVALISGLLPAIYSTRRDVPAVMQAGSSGAAPRNRKRLTRTAAIVQLAVSLTMVTAACLFGFSLQALRHFDAGVRRAGLFEVEIDPLRAGYQGRRATMLDEALREQFRTIPGIRYVTFSQGGLYSGRNFGGAFEADGFHPAIRPAALYDYVGPKFFTTLGTTILAGRDFDERDNLSGPKVVIVNQTMANRVFPGRDAIGRHLYVQGNNGEIAYRIIGVVRDVRTDLRETPMMWYFPAMQHAEHPFTTRFLLRAAGRSHSLRADVTAALRAENPSLRIDQFETVDRLLDNTIGTDRLLARLGSAFGILALLLASVGVYGLLSYDVSRRTTEIGIRTALGAFRLDIIKLVLSEAAIIGCGGLLIGGFAALMLSRLVRGLVFGIRADDFRFELAAAMILALTAFLAAAIPARRASRLEPMRALRSE